MEKEIRKKIHYPMTLLMVLFFFIPALINAQTKESSSGAIDDLLGKWSGTWSRPDPRRAGQDFLMEIKKVDQDKETVEIAYSWTGVRGGESGEGKAKATFIPPDKLEWYTKAGVDYKFHLKGGELWGTRKTRGGETQKIVLKKPKE